MKYPSKNWPTFAVRFWTHRQGPGIPTVNDCFGNSQLQSIKARSPKDAQHRASLKWGALRFHSVAAIERLAAPSGFEKPRPLNRDDLRILKWVQGQAHEWLGAHIGGPYEQEFRNDLQALDTAMVKVKNLFRKP